MHFLRCKDAFWKESIEEERLYNTAQAKKALLRSSGRQTAAAAKRILFLTLHHVHHFRNDSNLPLTSTRVVRTLLTIWKYVEKWTHNAVQTQLPNEANCTRKVSSDKISTLMMKAFYNWITFSGCKVFQHLKCACDAYVRWIRLRNGAYTRKDMFCA